MVKASIIILNYNGKKFLKECFNSLKKQSYKDFEIIFVDNASKGDDVAHAKTFLKNFKNQKIIVNEKNLGFSEGNNRAYKEAKGNYVILLNNDTILHKDWLKNLIKKAESDNKIAIVGSISAPFSDKMKNVSMGKYPPSTLGITGADILTDKDKTAYIDGASMLIRKEHFKNLFDPEYFAYAEDAYISWKANIKGYKILYTDSRYLHYGSGTSSKMSGFATYFVERNMLTNFLIFYEKQTLMKIIPLIILSRKIKFLSKLMQLDFSGMFALVKADLWVSFHLPRMLRKRKIIQKQRKVSDLEILKRMSYKLFRDDNSFIAKVSNKISQIYCKILNIKTIENEGR